MNRPNPVVRCCLILLLLWLLPAIRAESGTKSFAVPAGPAPDTLKQFAVQAGIPVLFSAPQVEGVNTNEVNGDLVPLDALAVMLRGTPLFAVRDERTGGITVLKKTAEKASSASPVARPADEADPDRIVKLDAFEVSTVLGNYAETSASTGTKVPMDLIEVPSTVQVLNASFLNDRNATSLDDVYNYVLGMARQSEGATDFSLRGFTSHGAGLSLHSLEVDGMPGLTTRFGSPNTANIERVEILKGPASLLYGLSTPGGLVNLVTKPPQPEFRADISATVSTFAGGTSSFGQKLSYTGTVDVTGAIDADKHWLYRAIVRDDDLDSFRDNNFGQNQYFYPSLTYVFTPDTSLAVQVEVLRQKRLADYTGLVVPNGNLALLPAYNVNYNNPTDIERDIGNALTAIFRHNLGNDWHLTVSNRDADNTNGRRQLDYSSLKSAPLAQNTTLIRTYRDFVGNNNRVDYFDGNLQGEIGPANFRQTILIGGSYDIDFVGLRRTAQGPVLAAIPVYGTAAPVPYPADGASQTNTKAEYYIASGYFSDHVKIGEHLFPSVGVRYDHQDGSSVDRIANSSASQSSGAVVPNAGLLYLFTSQLSAYASYNASFFPNSLTAYDANNHQGVFDPQTAKQVEAGIKSAFLNGRLNATASVYRIDMRNVLETTAQLTAQGNGISQLDGGQQSKGTEVEISWLVVPNWQVTAGFSNLEARITKSQTLSLIDTPLPEVPKNTGNFWTRYNFAKGPLVGLGAGLGVTYEGYYPTTIPGVTVAAHTLVDGALYYQRGRTKLALNLENALDKKYIQSLSQDLNGVWPGSPRQITFSIDVRL